MKICNRIHSFVDLTHTVTHTGKGADGTNGDNGAAHHGSVEQTGPERAKKQPMNGCQSVGKDEVGSSNLPSSSKKKDTTYVVSFFLGSAGRRPAPPVGISILRAAEPPPRRGFACGKTLVRHKSAAAQKADKVVSSNRCCKSGVSISIIFI